MCENAPCRLLALVLIVAASGPVVAESDAQPDVRANIMQMLEQARRAGTAVAPQSAPVAEAPEPTQPVAAPAAAVSPKEARPLESVAPSQPATRYVIEPRRDWFDSAHDGYLRRQDSGDRRVVPLPRETITIGSPDEVVRVNDAFEAARERARAADEANTGTGVR